MKWLIRLIVLTAYLVPCTIYAQSESSSEMLYVDFSAQSPLVPEIEWVFPLSGKIAVTRPDITVEFRVNSPSDISEIGYTLNKKLYNISETQAEGGTYKIDLMLGEGISTINLKVENEAGYLTESKKVLQFHTKGTLARTDHALVIGTDNYEQWSDLTNPVHDAKTFAGELNESFGFETDTLFNPTKTRLLEALRDYAKKDYLHDDQLLIFIAGHGVYDDLFGQGYIVCSNSQNNDKTKESYLSHSNLREIIDNIPCQHILIIIDACFGGTFDPSIAKATAFSRGSTDIYKQIEKDDYIRRKLRYKTRRYITSGGKEYVPDGRPGMHSPFVRQLLDGLRGGYSGNKVITINDILQSIELVTPEPRFGEFGKNEPGSDFLFVGL